MAEVESPLAACHRASGIWPSSIAIASPCLLLPSYPQLDTRRMFAVWSLDGTHCSLLTTHLLAASCQGDSLDVDVMVHNCLVARQSPAPAQRPGRPHQRPPGPRPGAPRPKAQWTQRPTPSAGRWWPLCVLRTHTPCPTCRMPRALHSPHTAHTHTSMALSDARQQHVFTFYALRTHAPELLLLACCCCCCCCCCYRCYRCYRRCCPCPPPSSSSAPPRNTRRNMQEPGSKTHRRRRSIDRIG
jgi:hypothetical protein